MSEKEEDDFLNADGSEGGADKTQVDQTKPPKVKPNDRPLAKGKSRITVVMPDGHTKRKKRAIDSGLSELILPPYTKGVQAVYCTIGNDRIDPATKLPPEPKDVIMQGSYVLNDKFNPDPFSKVILMKNVGRKSITRDKDGKEKIEETINDVVFERGMLRVDVTNQYPLYCFLELHPLNASNRHRSNINAPSFHRVDIKTYQSEATKAALMDLAWEAEKEVMDMKEKNEILGMAVSAGVYQSGLDVGAIKNALRTFAKNNPKKYFGLSNNPKPSIRLNILDAMTLGIIDYNPDTKAFILAEENHKLHTCLVGEDPVESFVNELVKPENAESYEQLCKLIDYWE